MRICAQASRLPSRRLRPAPATHASRGLARSVVQWLVVIYNVMTVHHIGINVHDSACPRAVLLIAFRRGSELHHHRHLSSLSFIVSRIDLW